MTETKTAPVPDGYLQNYDGFQADWISTSALACLMRCGMAFYYKYIELIPEPKSVRLACGSATHKGREVNLKQKVETEEDLPVEEVTDAARDSINETWASSEIHVEKEWEGKSTDEARGIAVDLATDMAAKDREIFHPQIRPAAVEETVAISFPSLPRLIVGKKDVREKGNEGILRDLKTGKRAFGQSKADSDMGLTTYGLLEKVSTGQAPDRYLIDNVIARSKTKPTRTEVYETVRSEKRLEQQLARFALAMEIIQKGAFMCCNPGDWVCSESWCGYWRICPYAA